MSRETLKTVTISLTSSFCTALFLVACTAAANKQTSTDNGDRSSSNGSSVGGGSDSTDAATIAALEARVLALEDFREGTLCFFDHMTDSRVWRYDHPSQQNYMEWQTITGRYDSWAQGTDSDASKAYDDCF